MSELTSTSGKHILQRRVHTFTTSKAGHKFGGKKSAWLLKFSRSSSFAPSSMILYAFTEGTDGASPFLVRSSYRTGPSRYEELKRKVGIDPLIAIGKGPKKQTQTHCGFCLNNGAHPMMRWLSNTGNKFGSI